MLFIKNGYIKTMVGPDLENGCILIDDNGKILSVAADLTAPEGATVVDAAGRLVTPGCVDAHCHIGLDNEACGWEGLDLNERVDPLTPQMRAIDSINPQDEAFGLDGYDLFELVARKRGMLMSGGAVNSSRCAEMLLDEFRGAVIGKISLESPDDVK